RVAASARRDAVSVGAAVARRGRAGRILREPGARGGSSRPRRGASRHRGNFSLHWHGAYRRLFFAGQNIDYRGIFFIFVLPGLLALARAGGAPRIFFRTAILIVFLMWGELFREALQHIAPTNADPIWQTVKASFWLLRELVWWRVIGVLLGLLIGLVARAPLLERIVPPRWRAA